MSKITTRQLQELELPIWQFTIGQQEDIKSIVASFMIDMLPVAVSFQANWYNITPPVLNVPDEKKYKWI